MPCPMPSEDIVTPAFGVARRRPALGVRLEGRTGNIPSSGLSPNQFTAVSEAALYDAPERATRGREARPGRAGPESENAGYINFRGLMGAMPLR